MYTEKTLKKILSFSIVRIQEIAMRDHDSGHLGGTWDTLKSVRNGIHTKTHRMLDKKRTNKKTEFTEMKIVDQMNCFPSPEASKTKQAHCNIWPQRRRNTNTTKKKEERRNAKEIERCSAKNMNALTCF